MHLFIIECIIYSVIHVFVTFSRSPFWCHDNFPRKTHSRKFSQNTPKRISSAEISGFYLFFIMCELLVHHLRDLRSSNIYKPPTIPRLIFIFLILCKILSVNGTFLHSWESASIYPFLGTVSLFLGTHGGAFNCN